MSFWGEDHLFRDNCNWCNPVQAIQANMSMCIEKVTIKSHTLSTSAHWNPPSIPLMEFVKKNKRWGCCLVSTCTKTLSHIYACYGFLMLHQEDKVTPTVNVSDKFSNCCHWKKTPSQIIKTNSCQLVPHGMQIKRA